MEEEIARGEIGKKGEGSKVRRDGVRRRPDPRRAEIGEENSRRGDM